MAESFITISQPLSGRQRLCGVEMCKFLAGELEWNLIGRGNAVAKEVEMLDQTQFGKGK